MKIVLVDRNYHKFHPLLCEVAMTGLEADCVVKEQMDRMSLPDHSQ